MIEKHTNGCSTKTYKWTLKFHVRKGIIMTMFNQEKFVAITMLNNYIRTDI